MSDDDKCILCGMSLFGSYTTVSEGKLCVDSMGCRRRALALMERNRGVLQKVIDYAVRRRA